MADTRTALGVHCFAGGITLGFLEHFKVIDQLETFDLGVDTVRYNLKLPVQHAPFEEWSLKDYAGVDVIFGNPRCTGFSCLSNGCSEDGHGAWSRQTVDIHQTLAAVQELKPAIWTWESVQQAGSIGRELLEYLMGQLPGYRFAEVYLNAATFGNPQYRKRFFFVAYRDDLRFNLEAPPLADHFTTVWECIGGLECAPVESDHRNVYKDIDALQEAYSTWVHAPVKYPYNHHWMSRPALDRHICSIMHEGRSLSKCSPTEIERTTEAGFDKYWNAWLRGVGFSWHAPFRLHRHGPSKVIYSGARNYVHPTRDRAITVREAARLMGMPDDYVFLGEHHGYAQIGKGVVPQVASWFAGQLLHSLNGAWGGEDFEVSFDRHAGMIVNDVPGKPFKLFDMTRYCWPKPQSRG